MVSLWRPAAWAFSAVSESSLKPARPGSAEKKEEDQKKLKNFKACRLKHLGLIVFSKD